MVEINVAGCNKNNNLTCVLDGEACLMGEMDLCEYAREQIAEGKQIVFPAWYSRLTGELRDGKED